MTRTKDKIIGIHFLHSHPQKQRELNLDDKHVIIDRDEWEAICRFFNIDTEKTINFFKQLNP